MDARGAATVDGYLAKLPADRREAIAKVREVVSDNLPDGFEEGVQYGMISWYVPLARYPDTYNGQPLAIASLASQKGHMALYLLGVYGDEALAAWFRDAFAKAGKKLDMGKSCVRFKSLDALPLDVIGEVIRRVPLDAFLAKYEEVRAATKGAKAAKAAKGAKAAGTGKQAAAKKPSAKKPTAKKPTAKKPAAKKPAAKKPAKSTRRGKR